MIDLPTMPPPAAPLSSREESGQLLGLARLARMAFAGENLGPLRDRLLHRLARNENDAHALLDLSIVLQLMGQRQLGLSMQTLALNLQQVYRVQGSGDGAGIRLLGILTPGDLAENNALEFLLEDSDVTYDMLFVSPSLPFPATVPDHDLAMVAVCETDGNRPLLAALQAMLDSWPRPVACAPHRIARLSRDGACGLLETRPGMVVPVTRRLDRPTLAGIARGERPVTDFLPDGSFPIIVRPLDSQKGHGLRKLDEPPSILEYLNDRPEEAFYVARYVEYRGPDGQFRKYRVVLIDGRPYVCHMAISDRWVVHYMSAGMVENAEKRAEEARFFAAFDQDFARRHHHALLSIARQTELEYVGIDCGETPAGEFLVFEVDSGMTVHAMDPVDLFPYKQPQMRKVFSAFRQMLIDTAARHRTPSPGAP